MIPHCEVVLSLRKMAGAGVEVQETESQAQCVGGGAGGRGQDFHEQTATFRPVPRKTTLRVRKREHDSRSEEVAMLLSGHRSGQRSDRPQLRQQKWG
jgi:hypothetical protein